MFVRDSVLSSSEARVKKKALIVFNNLHPKRPTSSRLVPSATPVAVFEPNGSGTEAAHRSRTDGRPMFHKCPHRRTEMLLEVISSCTMMLRHACELQ